MKQKLHKAAAVLCVLLGLYVLNTVRRVGGSGFEDYAQPVFMVIVGIQLLLIQGTKGKGL